MPNRLASQAHAEQRQQRDAQIETPTSIVRQRLAARRTHSRPRACSGEHEQDGAGNHNEHSAERRHATMRSRGEDHRQGDDGRHVGDRDPCGGHQHDAIGPAGTCSSGKATAPELVASSTARIAGRSSPTAPPSSSPAATASTPTVDGDAGTEASAERSWRSRTGRWVPDDEHQQGEPDCRQPRQERVTGIDPPEAALADHDTRGDLADDHRRTEAMHRGEQGSDKTGSDDERERPEAHDDARRLGPSGEPRPELGAGLNRYGNDRAAERRHDRPNDRQAEPASADVERAGFVEPHERFEDPLAVVGRNRWAIVGDGQCRPTRDRSPPRLESRSAA